MEEENVTTQTTPEEAKLLVQEIIGLIEQAKSFESYRVSQKKECETLVWRLKQLLPLLLEVREVETTIPDPGSRCLMTMKKAAKASKKLLKTCHGDSRIYLALENGAILGKFHDVYDKLNHALSEMPYAELGISDQVKQQMDEILMQLKKVKGRTDTQDMELVMDLLVSVYNKDGRNADSASIERLAHKLGLQTLEELNRETILVRKLVKDKKGQIKPEAMQQIIDLLNKFKRAAGLPEEPEFQDSDFVMTKSQEKAASIVIPNEFLCPITLEIMSDPVIISTGQTYERESIQRWFDSNHKTCPKTGQALANLLLAPNIALKNLIQQWSEIHNFPLPKKDPPANADTHINKDSSDLQTLVHNLSSNLLEEQRKAVEKIRLLSKGSSENRISIASCGAIPPLVQLLSYPDSRIQEHAVTALLNLSLDESNKKLISRENPISAIIEVLQKGTVGARENSAAALFSLSMLDENKVEIGSRNGIPPLIDLLKGGTIRGKKDAITALFNICLNQANKTRAIEGGIIEPLLKFLMDKKLDIVDEILSILLIFASHPTGRQEMGQLKFVETLVNLVQDGTPKNKECAAAVLLELGSHNSNLMLAALQFGVYNPLVEVAQNGTDRAQRKAKSILQLMSKAEQIP
nr:U-box domain-containing protein 15 [Ipomoea trifida]